MLSVTSRTWMRSQRKSEHDWDSFVLLVLWQRQRRLRQRQPNHLPVTSTVWAIRSRMLCVWWRGAADGVLLREMELFSFASTSTSSRRCSTFMDGILPSVLPRYTNTIAAAAVAVVPSMHLRTLACIQRHSIASSISQAHTHTHAHDE